MASVSSIFVGKIVPASTLIPIGIGVRYWKKTDTSLRIMWWYLVMSFIVNVSAIVLADNGKNNLPLLHFDTLMEGLLLFSFFSLALRSGTAKLVCKVLCFVFPLVCISELLFVHSIWQYNTFSRPLESFIISILAIYFLSEQLGRENRTPLESAVFFVVVGALLYFSASFFQFLFSNLMSKYVAKTVILWIWNIHACFVLCMYLLMAAGFNKLKDA